MLLIVVMNKAAWKYSESRGLLFEGCFQLILLFQIIRTDISALQK